MASELKLLGWRAEGLRCPDHAIDFQRQEKQCYPISLIQMPNGTGKTTTLKLLRAALCGVPDEGEWTPDAVRQLAKRNSRESGRFTLSLVYNERRMTIALRFDFDAGRVQYTTTVGDGLQEGFRPPRELRRFFNKQFVRFFVFDGELAEQLLDHKHTDAESAIENLFQLSVVGSMSRAVERYWQDQTSGRNATEDKGLTRRRNRVDKLRARLSTLRQEKGELGREDRRLSEELQARRMRFDHELKEQEEFGGAGHRCPSRGGASYASGSATVRRRVGKVSGTSCFGCAVWGRDAGFKGELRSGKIAGEYGPGVFRRAVARGRLRMRTSVGRGGPGDHSPTRE